MDESIITNNNYSPSFIKRIKEQVFHWIRLTNRPVVKVYHSYGGNDQIVVMGHVLKTSPLPRVKHRRNFWTNTMALIRLFIVEPIPHAKESLTFQGETIEQVTGNDGFFRFQWSPFKMPTAGWHKVTVNLAEGIVNNYHGAVTGE